MLKIKKNAEKINIKNREKKCRYWLQWRPELNGSQVGLNTFNMKRVFNKKNCILAETR
jgi:hypothetical protein